MRDRFAEMVAAAGKARHAGQAAGFRFGRGARALAYLPDPAPAPFAIGTARERKPRPRLECPQCREPFSPKELRYAAYCSLRCAARSRGRAWCETGCPVCGGELVGRRVYCSARCGTAAAMRRYRQKNLKRSCP